MTRAEKIGTRRGFNNDVKNLGNGKAAFEILVEMVQEKDLLYWPVIVAEQII